MSFLLLKRVVVEPSGVSVGVGKVPQENPWLGWLSARRERSDWALVVFVS